MAKEKSIQVLIKMSQEELDIIKKRMEIMNIKNKSEFIRRMAIYGYMLQLDLDALQRPLKLMGNISNNINQIAIRVNSTGSFYQQDLEELQGYYRQLKNDIVPVILSLSKDGV